MYVKWHHTWARRVVGRGFAAAADMNGAHGTMTIDEYEDEQMRNGDMVYDSNYVRLNVPGEPSQYQYNSG